MVATSKSARLKPLMLSSAWCREAPSASVCDGHRLCGAQAVWGLVSEQHVATGVPKMFALQRRLGRASLSKLRACCNRARTGSALQRRIGMACPHIMPQFPSNADSARQVHLVAWTCSALRCKPTSKAVAALKRGGRVTDCPGRHGAIHAGLRKSTCATRRSAMSCECPRARRHCPR
jgi:hypothetical protein